jgi:uncharacterized LabA/DUF88 family protein
VIARLPDALFLNIFNMEDCIVLVDNGFFKLVKKEFEKITGKPKKFLQTFRNICNSERFNLKHLFVYMAPPFQSRIQTEEENIRKSRYDQIKKMLDSKKWVSVREGRCQRIFDETGNVTFNKKGVDSWIVADLCLFKEDFPEIKKVILISSDSDFAPIIEMITKKKQIEVVLYTYFENNRNGNFHRSNHLIKACNRYKKLKPEDFD